MYSDRSGETNRTEPNLNLPTDLDWSITIDHLSVTADNIKTKLTNQFMRTALTTFDWQQLFTAALLRRLSPGIRNFKDSFQFSFSRVRLDIPTSLFYALPSFCHELLYVIETLLLWFLGALSGWAEEAIVQGVIAGGTVGGVIRAFGGGVGEFTRGFRLGGRLRRRFPIS